MTQQHDLPMLAGIAGVLRWIEELIVIISAPLLMFGLIVALIDLLTDGSLSLAVPWLIYGWAISQAIGVEANMSGSVFKLRMAWKSGQGVAVVGYFVLAVSLGGVAVVAGYAYAFHQSQGVAIPQTLRDLGINAASWTLVRSVLSVVLVAVSALLRYTPAADDQAKNERQRLLNDIELEPLRAQALAAKALKGRTVFAAMVKGVAAPVTQPSATQEYGQPNETPYGPVPWGGDLRAVSGPSIHLVKSSETPVRTPRKRPSRRKPRGAASWEAKARAAWDNGARSKADLLRDVPGISEGSAQYWSGVFRGEARGEERARAEA
jgi:hypothetical protein